jgi:hypothetical protein
MADFVIRPKFERPSKPNDGFWKGALGSKLWEAPLYVAIAAATANSFRSGPTSLTRPRPRQPAAHLSLQTQPNQNWLYGHSPVLWEAPKFVPIHDQGASFRMASAPPNRFTSFYQTDPNDGWVYTAIAAATWDSSLSVPPTTNEIASFRTWDRTVDRLTRLTQPNDDGWPFTSVDASLAQTWSGVEELDSYRQPPSRADRFFVQQTSPSFSWLSGALGLWEASAYPPIGDAERLGSYRTPDRVSDRTFLQQGQPLDVEQFAPTVAAGIAQVWPGIEGPPSFLTTPAKTDRFFILQGQPLDVEQFGLVVGAQLVAQQWPAIAETPSYRVPAAAQDRTFVLQGQPLDVEQFSPTLASQAAQLWPAIAETPSFLTPTARRDRFFLQLGQPIDVAAFAGAVAGAPTPAQLWPAIESRGAYRVPAAAVDRFYIRQTQPADVAPFAASVAQGIVRGWAAVQAVPSFRTPAAIRDPLLSLRTQPLDVAAAAPSLQAQFWPAIAELPSYVTSTRIADRFYIRQTAPSFSWLQGHTPTLWEVPYLAAIAAATVNSRPPLPFGEQFDVRQTEPANVTLLPPTAAQLWPAFELRASYSMPARTPNRTVFWAQVEDAAAISTVATGGVEPSVVITFVSEITTSASFTSEITRSLSFTSEI